MKTIKAPTSNSMDGKIRSNHTIITAYFLVNKTKRHSDSNYIELMERLFSNSDPMIIYTSPEVAPLLAEIRGKPERTVVIPMNLSDTNLVKRYPRPAFWESVSKDGRGAGINNGYDYNLYQIWNSKVDFLKLGSDMNPFQSNFFAWMDAGFVRWDEYTNSTIIQRIPPELPETKLAIMNITPIIHFKTHHQMGGGTFGGYKPAVDLYHAKYYEKFHEYANSTDRYTHVSNEQLVLYETCRDNDGLCFTINPRKSNNNAISWGLQVPYFYMLPFFNTREYEEMEEKNFVDKSRW
ncbi:unnamed protein product [Cylindrotheca closterium]|uniref:Uncharacterized protein n=1 Tax=Cylindrotheca closterium TaxID=2856 RepID=A0AAD2G0M3_9STRA|nr:unnamed protein product [Cylindrotheca closterium]